jgi:hypothetical protein
MITGVQMKKEVQIAFPTDEYGLTGRECPSCKGYFKVKFGTGLPTSHCICPYCGEKSDHDKFFTQAQIEYAQSIAIKEVLGPELKKLERSFKELERSTRGGFIQFKVKTSGFNFPLKYYQEKELETYITCDNCGLEFAVFGVFASCPDCTQLNALVIFNKSIDVAKKRLVLIDSLDEADVSLKDAILEDSLSGGVSAFDGFGKALRNKYPDKLSLRPKNLFQNVVALSDCLTNTCGKSLSDLVGKSEFEFLIKFFQVRHIYEHNMGVVDSDFVKKVPGLNYLKGKKYPLERTEIEKFLNELSKTGNVLMNFLEKV